VLSRTRPALDLEGRALATHPAGAESRHVEDLDKFLQALHAQGLHQVMVEGGPHLTQGFLEAGLWNEIWHFIGPRFLGGEGARFSAFGGGALPGLDLKLLNSQVLNDGTLFLKWGPTKGP
jgi:riboflavin biosynthesis pyrimidine reductase